MRFDHGNPGSPHSRDTESSMKKRPPDASLGRMLSESQTYLGRAPWYALFTGLAIVLMILGLSLLSEGIQQRRRS